MSVTTPRPRPADQPPSTLEPRRPPANWHISPGNVRELWPPHRYGLPASVRFAAARQPGGLAFSGLHHRWVAVAQTVSFARHRFPGPLTAARSSGRPRTPPLYWVPQWFCGRWRRPAPGLRSCPPRPTYLPGPPTGRQGVAGPAGSARVAAPAATSPAATTGRTAPASPVISGAIARVTPAKMPSTMAGAAAPDIEREASATIRPTSSTIRPTSAAIRATSAQTAARRLAPSVPHPVTSTLRALAPLVSLRGARTTSSPPGTPVLSCFPAPALRHTAVLARLGTPAPAILGAGAAPIHNAATPTVLRAPSPAHRGPDTPAHRAGARHPFLTPAAPLRGGRGEGTLPIPATMPILRSVAPALPRASLLGLARATSPGSAEVEPVPRGRPLGLLVSRTPAKTVISPLVMAATLTPAAPGLTGSPAGYRAVGPRGLPSYVTTGKSTVISRRGRKRPRSSPATVVPICNPRSAMSTSTAPVVGRAIVPQLQWAEVQAQRAYMPAVAAVRPGAPVSPAALGRPQSTICFFVKDSSFLH